MSEDFKNTIFKSSYWFKNILMFLFVNHDVGGYGTFSFVIKKGQYSYIYNLTKEENYKLVKNMVSKLNNDEKQALYKELSLNILE